jgi:hypothetical protein
LAGGALIPFTNIILSYDIKPKNVFYIWDMFIKFLLSKLRSAVRLCIEYFEKVKYARSFKRAAVDEEILELAEEGMTEYFEQLKK